APVLERAEGEDVDNVRVADLIDRTRFLHKALDQLRIGAELGPQHFDRGALADDRMYCGIDGRHTALTDDAFDAVFTHHAPGGQLCRRAAPSRLARHSHTHPSYQ